MPPEADGPVFFLGVWCHVSPAPDKVRGCNPARASLRPQAGRGRLVLGNGLKKSGAAFEWQKMF